MSNAAPIGIDDSFSAELNKSLVITPAELLNNDSDPDGQILRLVSVQDAVNGSVSIENGRVVFVPAQGFLGEASFTYTITDGARGFVTATVSVEVKAPAPKPAPSLDTVIDDVAPITGNIAPNGTTNDKQPTFVGTGEPGSTVTVSDNGKPIGSAAVDKDGNWTLTPAVPLADGPHSVTVQATDPAGNPSLVSTPRPFNVDTVATETPFITLTTDANDDGGITASELSLDGGRISVSIDLPKDAKVGDLLAITDQSGAAIQRELTPADINAGTIDLPGIFVAPPDGQTVSVEAVIIDKAGNVSPEAVDSAVMKLGTPLGAPDVRITEDANNDGFINAAELSGRVDVRISLPNGAKAGDTLRFTTLIDDVGQTGSLVLTPANIAAGLANLSFLPPSEGRKIIVSATVENAGGSSPAGTDSATRDTRAPGAPTVDGATDDVAPITGPIPPNGITNDAQPTFNGSGEPGSVVTVNDNGTPIGSAVVGPDGKWSLTPTTPLADGPHSVTAQATDPAGNTGPTSAPLPFTVDTKAPATPTLDSVTDDVAPVTGDIPPNGTTNDNRPTFNGSGEPGSVVTVNDNGTPIGSTVVGPDGKWSLTPTTPLADGPHSVTAQATDPAGNTSPATAPRPFIVDTQAPTTPTLDSVTDDVAPVTGDIPANGTTNDNRPTFNGSGEPGSVVTVNDNGTPIGSAVVGPDGKWSLTPTTPLADGPHSVTAQATDPAGNTSPVSAPRPFTVDTQAPATPTLDTVNDDVNPVTGNVPQGGTTDDTTPTFGGTGSPGSVITVKDGPATLGSTTVGPDGTWTLTPAAPLSNGPHSVTATASDAAGNESAPTLPRTFTMDNSGAGTTTLDTVNDDVAPKTGDVPPNGSTNDATPTFGGTAKPNSVVTVSDNGTPIGSTTAGPDGKWSLTPTTPLADGPHSVTAQATDPSGNTSPATAPRPFTVDTQPPATPTLDSVSDDVAPVTGDIPPNGTTNDNRPTFNGSGEPGSVVTVNDNGTPIGSAVVGPDGKWSLTPTTPLADGPHSVTAQATDPAGNTSPVSAPRPFTVDTQAPATPTLDTVNDDVNPVTGNVPQGGTTDDTTPTFGGTGSPGSVITVKDGPATLGSTTVGPDGTWTLTPAAPLSNGPHSVTATASDAAGNESAPTLPRTFTIDNSGAGTTTLDTVNDDVAPKTGDVPPNGSTNDATPTFGGTTKPNSVVTVSDNGTPIGSTTAGPDGKWSLTPTTPLADGPHSVTAQATDPAGNTSPATAPRPFTVDTQPPATPTLDSVSDDVAPVTGDIPPNGTTNDNRPTFNGSGEPGSVVTVNDNGTPIGSTVVGPDGKWSLTPTTPLADGPHSVTAQATDPAGNTSPATAPRPFIVDTQAPTTPTLDSVTDDVAPVTGDIPPNGTTNDNRPTFNGSGEPGSVVTVNDNGTPIGSAVVGPDGKWSLTPTTPLADGPHSVTAQATDPAGNTSPASAPRPFTVDTQAPATPTLDTVNDDVNPVTGNVPQGGTTDDTTPTFGGTGSPGSVISVKDGPATLGSTTVGPDGTWTLTPAAPLSNGPHSVTATASDAAGNESAPTLPRTFTIDNSGAGTTTLDTVNDDVAPKTGDVPPNGSTNDATPTFGGTAKPNSVVTVSDNGAPIGSTTAGPDGTWSLTPTTPLADGPHSVTAQATDPAGNTSPATAPRPFIVDTQAPTTPTLDSVTDDVAPVTGDIPPNGTTNDNRPTFNGSGEPGSVVTVNDNGTPIGSAVVGPDGKWSLTPTTPLADGPHSVTAQVTDPAGNTSPVSAPRPFTVDTQAPATPTLDTVNDDVNPVTGNVPQGGTTDDTTPTFGGTGSPGSVITVKDGPAALGSTTVGPDGTWTLTPAAPLSNGPHSVTATASDAAGNESAPTLPRTFTIDNSGAGTTTLDTVNDDVAPKTGDVPPNGSTNDPTPTFGGTAKPNSVVTVSDNGTPIGSTTAGPDGKWSLTPTTPLADGPHSVTAQATDPAGNTSPATAPRPFTVDTQAPATPTLDTVNDDVAPLTGDVPPNGTTNDNRPTFNGSGEPGSVVTVNDNGTPIGSAVVGPDGKWSLTPTTPLADGPHSVTAQATDPAGNTSPVSAPRPFTVDTQAPAAPAGAPDMTPQTDTGVSSSDDRTRDNTPNFAIADPGANTPSLYVDGVKVPATYDPVAKTLTPNTPLPDGPHDVAYSLTDQAGNESPPSPVLPIVIDTVAPANPIITKIVDDFGAKTGDVANGGKADDATPTLVGTSEANSIVTVKDGATVIGSTVADAAGNWKLTPANPVAPGGHPFVATAEDPAGNVSGPSNTFNYVLGSDIPGPVFNGGNGLKGPIVFQAWDGVHGIEPWVTDLTESGTALLKDIFVGTPNSLGHDVYLNRAEFTDLGNGKAVFQAFTPFSGGWEAWVTDGTTQGTKLLKDITPNGGDSFPVLDGFTALGNGKALFSAFTPQTGRELWITDGTESGTRMVKDIMPGGASAFSGNGAAHYQRHPGTIWADFTPIGGGKAVFQAWTNNNGWEPWITDGSEAGTFLLKDINNQFGNNHLSSNPSQFTDLGNGKFIFTASNYQTGAELWISDGTSAGTNLLKDINPGQAPSTPWAITKVADGKALFWADDGKTGVELWLTDGTSAGTQLLKDINNAPHTASANGYDQWSDNITALGNGLYVFSAVTTTNGSELWVTDLTPAGTQLLKDIAPGHTNSNLGFHTHQTGNGFTPDPYSITKVADGWALFSAFNFENGKELWITDGRNAWLVADIWNTQPSSHKGSNPSYITATGDGNAIFTAFEPSRGSEPYLFNLDTWKSLHDRGQDTSSSVSRLKDIHTYPFHPQHSSLAQDYTIIAGGSEDASFHLTPQRLLQGWTNADGTTGGLTVASVSVENGTATLQLDGSWTVVPDANFSGTMNVSYTVKSPNGGETAATYKLEFSGVSDVVKFDAGDNGPIGSPLLSNLENFSAAPRSQGGDVLDLRDMLSGESLDNLLNFLHVEKTGGDTVIHVSATGQFGSGFDEAKDTAKIVLGGVDFGTGSTSTELVNQLINQNKLLVDGLT